MTGNDPARRCRSDAPKLIAMRNKSSILFGINKEKLLQVDGFE
jgi:hypothetical protein